MKPVVHELSRASRVGCLGDRGGVGRYSGDVELLQEKIRFGAEPGGMARLEDGGTWVKVAQKDEEGFGDFALKANFGGS